MSSRIAAPALAAALALLSALLPTAGIAQQEEPAPAVRPRVGLVLGGGGARGFAHVGVLEALHDAGIPVDLVVGTSAGALVGGLYASGMPLAEIERLFSSQDWPALFDDEPSRSLAPLRRKRDERDLLIGFEAGIGLDGPRLPPGLIVGGELLTLLQSNTLHTRGIRDFDALPLRFRAIATDVTTGERVELDSGNLALAMRASSSVPGVFVPVDLDGRQLVDGGLVDNLPIRTARDLGADVVIAVDVGSLLDAGPDASAVEYIDQALTIMIRQVSDEAVATLDERDWLVVPELDGIGSSSFSSDAYERGSRAGRAAVEALRSRWPELRVDRARFEAWNRARTRLWEERREIEVAFVRADASRTALDSRLVRRLFTYRPGSTYDAAGFEHELGEVLGFGGFSDVSLSFVEEGGRTGISLRPTDKPWGPTFLQSGLVLSDRGRGRALWSLRAHLWNGRLNGWGGELRGRLHVGSQQLLGLEWYQPLHAVGVLFGAAGAEIRRDDQLVGTADGALQAVDVEERALELGVGVRLAAWGETRVGLRLAGLDVDRADGADGALPEGTELASWFARFEADVLDRVAFPSRGLLVRSEVRTAREFLIGDENFERLGADALLALSRGSHTVLLGAEIGTALGDSVPVGRDFQLGGLFRLSGAERGSLRGSYAGLGRIIYYLRPRGIATRLEGPPYRFGASLEVGQTWARSEDVDLADLLVGGTVFAALETPVGPIHAGWAVVDRRPPTWFFHVGPVF